MTRSLTLVLALLPACVVTTLEGPGDAPRVVAPPGKPADSSRTTEGAQPGKATEAPDPSDQERVAARHLLVAYRGAARAGPHITRTREEALARAEQALKRA